MFFQASAIALLQAAGASRIACVSMGKFGDVTCTYDLQVLGDPYQSSVEVLCNGRAPLVGRADPAAHDTFRSVLAQYLP